MSKKNGLEISNQRVSAQDIFNQTSAKIQQGLENPLASTGTPIEKLHGGAKFMAQLSNIGGGAISQGGGGIRDGFNTIQQNTSARAVLDSIKNKLNTTEQSRLEETKK